jgi:hypothetical protein
LLLFSDIQLEPFKLHVLETGALAVVSGYYLSVRIGVKTASQNSKANTPRATNYQYFHIAPKLSILTSVQAIIMSTLM